MAARGFGVVLVIAGLSALLLATACTSKVDGAPRRDQPKVGVSSIPLGQIMPTDAEIRAAVGNDLQHHPTPSEGTAEILPDGIRSDADAAPFKCVGVTEPRLRAVYEKAPVRGVAYQSYWNYGLNVAATAATTSAMRLASTTEAQQLFDSFVQQWRNCSGSTVTMQVPDSGETYLYSKITDVRVGGPVLSATVISWGNRDAPQHPVERAVGVAADVIIDVQVNDSPNAQSDTRAIDLVKAMARKVSSTS
ncbi:sensor domain-containing protein [Mycobacterium vicinigordonae]|uniref:Sensor domain-containing protein n=1 Tax=Mycobacterium vicinigordonae TaxID=1719132 RepID=A0A7D6E5L9_9MYCO|nr:sensor domain-containing protein [Mycobacterium vicinigordonae]QLL05845.1 sensor domain-containing protein [Mycobacterium vicinigordonae]